ncbi:MAG: sulfite reductase subunit A [Omnitrophica WOR_2 bacterium GWA2_45_18]|nr:MAG: sulfite reductase subunit A [Omnitrophica WOR_2 bacterium GWA2_45_18]
MISIIDLNSFAKLISALQQKGYVVIGPTVQGQAIVYDEITSVKDLPVGWGDEQRPGGYRIKKRGDGALFGYAVGPTSFKKFLFPPSLKLWQAQRTKGGFEIQKEKKEKFKMAFLGVRPCEIQGIRVQDQVFLKGNYADSHYQVRRKDVLIIAVNCAQPGGTCFCASMNTGPGATAGFDLCLTEIIEKDRHYFVVETGSPGGEALLQEVSHSKASTSELKGRDQILEQAKNRMGRAMDTRGIKELLYQNREHPQWEKVAQRCLSCANCTMVCPTCFCSSVTDVTDLTARDVQRVRAWDSCFTKDFSYIHGGHVRHSTKARYRQWMTHKLASWFDQFGTSGCVGCGRCITWCPVGIDITEELSAIRNSPGGEKPAAAKGRRGHEND